MTGDLNTTTTYANLLDVTMSVQATTFNASARGDAFDLDSDAGITFTNNNPEVTITGADYGINANNYGTGALSITTTGTTTGSNGTALRRITDLAPLSRLTRLPRRAVDYGINAENNGTGALSITATGTTTGTKYYGIYANNSSAGTSLTINAATTTGGACIYATNDGTLSRLTRPPRRRWNGISYNNGTGALSITTTGTTTGTNYDGIYANNSSAGTSSRLTRPPRQAGRGILQNDGTCSRLHAATTAGGDDGIYAYNNGTGALSITTTGTTTGTYGMASMRITLSSGTSLTINAATTTGGEDGIDAKSYGTGALSITTTGTTTGGTGDDGIYANYNLPAQATSRSTRPPRRAVRWHLCDKLWHRRIEHHNNGYDDGR